MIREVYESLKVYNNVVANSNGFNIYKVNSGNAFALAKDDTIIDVSRNITDLYNSARAMSNGSAFTNSVLIDVDSTLADFHKSLKHLLADNGYKFYPSKVTDYYGKGMTKNVIGCDWEIARKGMKSPLLYTDKYFILYPGIDEGIGLLQQYGFTTSGYTGAENVQEIYSMRQQFCMNHNLIPNVYIGDKPIITGYDALFDDNPYLVQRWLDSDTSTKIYLIEQPYNRGVKFRNNNGRVCRCKSFYEAAQRFLQDKSKEMRIR